uniref:Uncharacterized protein n=1 Tax=Prevotella sp. GTC17254 TaxID=3236794 RepID=A0AB33J4L4_9BACT
MGAKREIVSLDMVGRTENGTVYFSADEITVVFQFIGVNYFGFGQKKTLKHNGQSTVGTSAYIKCHNLAGLSIQGVHQPAWTAFLTNENAHLIHFVDLAYRRDRRLLDITCYL